MDEEEQYLTELTIKKVEVFGFRERKKTVELDFDRRANFLIGRNGTGKTTLINIIADVLSCRYQSLMLAPFEGIRVTFQHSNANYKPFLVVNKSRDDDGDVTQITFEFTDYKTKGPSFSQKIKSRFYRRNEDISNSSAQRIVKIELEKRLSLTWLALSRSNGLTRSEKSNADDLDFRLEHSLQRLGTFFTRLDSKFADELQKFQQEWFMSLLVSSNRKNPSNLISGLNIAEEGKQVREMLKGIGIPEGKFIPKVEKHMLIAQEIKDGDFKSKSNDPTNFIADIYDISRLHHWVEQWQELQGTKENIYTPKKKFLEIANEMLFKKKVAVDEGNRLYIRKDGPEDITKASSAFNVSSSRKFLGGRFRHYNEISVSSLSSGEKQLLIFLTETVLQEGAVHLFLADEPELSLHIEWQEKLVPVILDLNPNAQILFATHSPDIVNKFTNVLSMEDIVH